MPTHIHELCVDDTLWLHPAPPYLDKQDSLEIQVKLTDSMKRGISESNVYSGSGT
jgi:hypothetical protein